MIPSHDLFELSCYSPSLLSSSTDLRQTPVSKEVETVYPDAHALYLDLHEHPELSAHETQTATKLAARLRSAGYEVTEHVGGTGIVAILKNGAGPTVMLRTELDALPVEEKTGLPYASKVRTKDDAGRDVPVMHACGHDLHMAIAGRHGRDHGTQQKHLARNAHADRPAR